MCVRIVQRQFEAALPNESLWIQGYQVSIQDDVIRLLMTYRSIWRKRILHHIFQAYRYMIWQEISYFDKGCKQLFEMPLLSIWVIQYDIIETLLILCRVFYIRSFSTLLRREKCPDDCACVHLVSRSSPATQKYVNPAKLLLLISA